MRTQLSVRVHRKRPFTGSTDKAALHVLIFGKIHGFRPHINFALMLRSEETHVCPPKKWKILNLVLILATAIETKDVRLL